MKFIKLTYPDGNFVHVNTEKIVIIDNVDGDQKCEMTKVYFQVKSSRSFMTWIKVKETPEEIVEMITK